MPDSVTPDENSVSVQRLVKDAEKRGVKLATLDPTPWRWLLVGALCRGDSSLGMRLGGAVLQKHPKCNSVQRILVNQCKFTPAAASEILSGKQSAIPKKVKLSDVYKVTEIPESWILNKEMFIPPWLEKYKEALLANYELIETANGMSRKRLSGPALDGALVPLEQVIANLRFYINDGNLANGKLVYCRYISLAYEECKTHLNSSVSIALPLWMLEGINSIIRGTADPEERLKNFQKEPHPFSSFPKDILLKSLNYVREMQAKAIREELQISSKQAINNRVNHIVIDPRCSGPSRPNRKSATKEADGN